MVFADRPPQRLPVDCVLAAHADGAGQAVAHLLGQGHRAIAYVGHSPVIHTARERLRGYRAALAEAGLEPHAVRTDAADAAAAHRATAELLAADNGPTALFADNPASSAAMARAIAESGAPRTALVAFDDSELAQVLGVTVVAQDPRELGRRAAELLFGRPRRRPLTPAARGPADDAGAARIRRRSRGRVALSNAPGKPAASSETRTGQRFCPVLAIDNADNADRD